MNHFGETREITRKENKDEKIVRKKNHEKSFWSIYPRLSKPTFALSYFLNKEQGGQARKENIRSKKYKLEKKSNETKG